MKLFRNFSRTRAVKRRGWSEVDVPDLTGRLAIVTGSTSGIGLQTARILVEHGARVVIAARNETKARAVMAPLRANHAHDQVEYHHLDVANLESVAEFARWFLSRDQALDVLINNAGIMMVPYDLTIDGNEQQFGTNHLGHFALTGMLLPALEGSPSARVVSVSSIAHKKADIDFGDLQFDGGAGYTPMRAYRRSKLANLLFSLEFDRRLREGGSTVASLCAHPGVADTNLGDHMVDGILWRIVRPVASAFVQRAEEGALPIVRAATDERALSGEYYGPERRGETTGPPVVTQPTALARDEDVAAQLWEASEELTSITFP